MRHEEEQQITRTPTDVAAGVVRTTIGLAFIAIAAGPVGIVAATAGEAFILNKARKDLAAIRDQRKSSSPKI